MAAGKQPGRSLPDTKEKEMKLSKILGLAAIAALALMAFASTASATTLKTNGVLQTGSTTISASAGSSITLSDTSGGLANTCSVSSVSGTTTSSSGASV